MQIPEYVKRELSEVYLLMDHIAGRKDKKLDEALAPPTTAGRSITLEEICGVAWPPSEQDRAKILALVLTAKDRLSHAASPATGHSVAFTYLSVNPPAGALSQDLRQGWLEGMARRQGWFAWLGQRLAWGRKRSPGSGTQHGAEAGDRDGKNDGKTGATDIVASDTASMAQFARDAFPGLEDKQDWLTRTTQFLANTLLILLILTCLISWDLAVGQRLLGDYRWLALHPQTMQNAQAATTPCENAPKPDADDACARYLAFERVRPSMQNWIRLQVPLRWVIQGIPPDDRSARGPYQGYILELNRVLVTTLNYDVLPLFLGALAATAAAWRTIVRKISGNELEPRDLLQVRERILLGAFLGAVIGLFISPGASNGLFTPLGSVTAAGSPGATSDTVALSPAAYAFLAGFATGRIFQWLDNLTERIFAFATRPP